MGHYTGQVHDQKLIVTLMSSKGSLGNVLFFHTYLVVVKTKIKFSKVLSTTQFIQKVINDRDGKFVLVCDFVEGMKIKTSVSSSFFIEYHDYWRIIRVGIQTDNTYF